jgi:hypothetical protein
LELRALPQGDRRRVSNGVPPTGISGAFAQPTSLVSRKEMTQNLILSKENRLRR